MKIADIIIRSGRSIKQAKARTILTSLAIGVGAFTIVLSLAVGAGGRMYASDMISRNTDPSEIYVQPKQDTDLLFGQSKPKKYVETTAATSFSSAGTMKTLSQTDMDKIAVIDGVNLVTPYYMLTPKYVTREGGDKYAVTTEVFRSSITQDYLAGGANNIKAGVVVIDEDYMTALGFSSASAAVGQKIQIAIDRGDNVLTGQKNTKLFDYEIGGVIKVASLLTSGKTAGVQIYRDDAKAMAEYSTYGTAQEGHYMAVIVSTKKGYDTKKISEEIASAGYNAKTAEDLMSVIFQFVNVLQAILVGFGILAVLTSVFGIINTQYISVLERTQQIGLMKALGMRRKDIGRLFKIEAAWIGLLGSVIGCVLAVVAGTIANPYISDLLGIGNMYLIVFQPLSIVAVVLGLVVVSVASGILPARKAARLDPIEALRTE